MIYPFLHYRIFFQQAYILVVNQYLWGCFMFNEICIYEAKLTKINEIEQLMKEVAEFYQQREGIIDVHYIKRIICTPSGIFAPASGYIAPARPSSGKILPQNVTHNCQKTILKRALECKGIL